MIGKNYHLAIAAQILKQAVRSWNDNNPNISNDMLKQLVDYLNKHLIEQDVTKTINGKDVVLRGEIVFNGIRYAPVKPIVESAIKPEFPMDRIK